MTRTPEQWARLQAMGLMRWMPSGAVATHVPTEPDARAPRPATSAPSAPSAPVSRVSPTTAMERSRPAPSLPMPASLPAPRAPVPAAAAREYAAAADPSALDWPELEAQVSACRACRLCEGRNRTVFGVGHRQAHWMIVGEAPGEQEDRQGEPFVGAAGQLLDRMLAALRLARGGDLPAERQVYIANTLKCRPPGNRNPTADELARCLPYLRRQIALVRPRIVLAMGRFAIEALTGSAEPVGRQRGRVHRFEGVPVVATYHPAYLLRSPAEKAKSWADLALAAAVVRGL